MRKRPTDKWSDRLKAANKLLQTELQLPKHDARAVVIATTAFAQECSAEITKLALADERERLCCLGSEYFRKLAINLERLPATLRRSIDNLILPLADVRLFDSEALDALLDGIASELNPHAVAKSDAERALRAAYCDPPKEGGEQTWDRHPPPLAVLYGGLHPKDRTRAETSANALFSSKQRISAGELFQCLATALAEQPAEKRPEVSESIVKYLERTAAVWRRCGLVPTRSNNRRIRGYRGPFHRFTDLILTAMTEPESRRDHAGFRRDGSRARAKIRLHQKQLESVLEQTRAAWNALPADLRREMSYSLPRRDVREIVSDDHLRKALSKAPRTKPAIPKTPPQTPS
jgi:hypothetical protein